VALVGNTECGHGQTQLIDTQVVFVVDVFADDGGEHAGCGVPGRQLTFRIGTYTLPFAPVWDNSQPHGMQRLYLPMVLWR
jgi:hypothetical protein